MTYDEAKTVVGSGPFRATYSRLKAHEKIFKELYEHGAFGESEYHKTEATMSLEELKSQEEPFRLGDDNTFLNLLEDYEDGLRKIKHIVNNYLLVAPGYCISIRNGMDVDTAALAHATQVEEETYNALAPHKRTICDDDGNEIGTEDTSAEDRATAHAAGETIWEAECCIWSK